MAEAKIVINYEQIIRALGAELQDVYFALAALDQTVEDNKAIINQIQNIKAIEIADEQNFVRKDREKRLRKGTLYVVVKFSPGATNFGSSVSPISLMCVGIANQVKPAQILLGVFASTWTAKNLCQEMVDGNGNDIEISDALQVWNTPEVITNFNEVDADFKNLFRLTGNIVVGKAAVRLGKMTYYYGDNYQNEETVNVMSFQDGYRASLDSQPFGNTNGFAQSEVNFSTYTFTISTYLLTGQLAADMLAVRGFRYRPDNIYNNSTSKFDANDKVKIKLEFNNGYTNAPGYDGPDTPEATSDDDPVKGDDFYMFYKVVDSQIGQELAGIPSLTITFTR